MSKDESIELPEGAIEHVERLMASDQNLISVYVNHANVSFTSWDMIINLGETLGEKNGKPIIKNLVKVRITREFAKAFAGLLLNNIKAFEREFGEIKIPIFGEPAKEDADDSADKDTAENPKSE